MGTVKADQFHFAFEVLWNDFDCEARASIANEISNPTIDDISIESMNVKEDAAITADDVDEETLLFFKKEALRVLKLRQ